MKVRETQVKQIAAANSIHSFAKFIQALEGTDWFRPQFSQKWRLEDTVAEARIFKIPKPINMKMYCIEFVS
jgi:hypothetical protein